jgi:SAM-dependent methyltransferase
MLHYYEEWWENPADIRTVIFDRLNRYVRQRIPDGRGRRALDLGSGKGAIVRFLVERGYEVTAVEVNEALAARLRRRFPEVRVLTTDVRTLTLTPGFDLITCIELVQNLPPGDVQPLLARLRALGGRLLINVSNPRSLHGVWVRLRGFKAPFVWMYTPQALRGYLRAAGFRVTHARGIGLVTPISLHRGFRGVLVPPIVARVLGPADRLAPGLCHLYYAEAE